MDLAIVSRRRPDVLTKLDGLKPLVWDDDIIPLWCRDRIESAINGGQEVEKTLIHLDQG